MSTVSDYTNYQNANQRLKDSYDADRAQTDENHQSEVDKIKASYEEQLDETRKELNGRIAEERTSAREEVQRLKDEMYDSKGKKATIEAREVQEQKRELSRFQEQIEKDSDQRVHQAQDYATERIGEADTRTSHKVESAVNSQKKAYSQQIHDLQDEMAVYRNEHRDVASATAQAKQDVIRQYEKGKLDEQKHIIDSYEAELARKGASQGELIDQTALKVADITYQANSKAQETVRQQKEMMRGQQRDYQLEHAYEKATHNVEMKGTETRNQMAQDHLISKHAQDTMDIVKNKDEVYGKFLTAKDAQMRNELGVRDQKIAELSRNDDPLKASPYLVSRIHQGEEKRFTAEMQENQAAYERNLIATRDRDVVDRRTLQDEYRTKFTQVNRDNQKQGDLTAKQFNSSYMDMKAQTENALLTERERSQRHAERVHQEGTIHLLEEHQRSGEALDEQRTQSAHEKNALVDENDVSRRSQDREWVMKMNDLRRSYENQFSAQHDEHEKAMSETHLEYDKKLRDLDRTSKRVLDDKVRAYEHQIKQQELSYREKERFLSEHYQEELDSMKRTNAQLIQKKS